MKGVRKICCGLLSALCIIFGLSLNVFSENTFADNYGNAARYPIQSCGDQVGSQYSSGIITSGQCFMAKDGQTGGVDGFLNSMSIVFEDWIPANSIISLDFHFNGMTTFYGFTPNANQTVLNQVVDHYNDNGTSVFHVFLEVYTSTSTKDLYFNTVMGYQLGNRATRINQPTVVLLHYSPTSAQMEDIKAKLNVIDSNISIGDDRLQYILGAVQDVGADADRTADAVEEQNQKDDEDRDNIEQQSSDAQDGADDSQQEAESTGTTLLAAFTSFVGALTNASPSNCNIDMDLGNLDLGVVNLCQLSPPAGFQAIASIFMILFCVPLSIATARKVINLFRSFQT